MNRSMFSRLVTVFLAVIIACCIVLMSFFYVYIRNAVIDTNIEELKNQAREIAYLSNSLERRNLTFSNQFSANERYVQWKISNLFEKYGAYCIVINNTGEAKLYTPHNILSDEEMLATLRTKEMQSTVHRVLSGEEVITQGETDNGTMFTVAVPWIKEEMVQGAVVIQTASQTVEAAFHALFFPAILIAVIALVVATLLSLFFTKQVTKPLTQMEYAVRRFATGDFSVKATEKGSREIRALAKSFNEMAAQFSELEQSRKEFVANVSHELRSPITSVHGYLQSMQDGTIPQEEQEKYIKVVLAETKRLSKLIHSLLSLSRMERKDLALTYTAFNVNEMIRRVLINKMNEIDEMQIEIDLQFDDEPCMVSADADQIEQVLVNLLDNALKFSNKKGIIAFHTYTENKIVYVRISDTGKGILQEDVSHIFDRFYKADKAHTNGNGTGLGLAICKRILEMHNQTIYLCDSDMGATFEFTLKKDKE